MNQNIADKLVQSGHAVAKKFSDNFALFCLGDSCENYVIVKEGSVRVELLSTSGQQMLLYRITAGQSCVMTTSCLLGNSQYFAQAFSDTPIELILLPKAAFNTQLQESSEFRDFVFSGFHERFAGLMNRTAELVTNTVDQRLASALLGHASTEEINKPIDQTHQQLAIEIGSAREVVSRRLAIFEKNGYVKKHRGHIEILDAEKLDKLLAR